MIQRIQSLYLLIVAALAAALCYATAGDIIILPVLTAVGAGTAFSSIFLYKNRKRQVRLSYLNISLFLLIFGIAVGNVLLKGKALNPFFYTLAINIILTLLAIRAIKKDEDLIKSLDRIR